MAFKSRSVKNSDNRASRIQNPAHRLLRNQKATKRHESIPYQKSKLSSKSANSRNYPYSTGSIFEWKLNSYFFNLHHCDGYVEPSKNFFHLQQCFCPLLSSWTVSFPAKSAISFFEFYHSNPWLIQILNNGSFASTG